MLRRFHEAEIQINQVTQSNPDNSTARLFRALIFSFQGNEARALELIYDNDVTFRYPITSVYSLLNMKVEAIENIRLGIELSFDKIGDYYYSYPVLINNPCYSNLFDDPRYQEILKKEKIKYEEKIEKYGGLKLSLQ
jgi:hypothetical protein